MLIDIADIAVLLVQLAFVIGCGLWLAWWLITLHSSQKHSSFSKAHWTGLPVAIVSFAISTVLLSWTNNLFRTIYLRMVTDVRWRPFCVLLDDIILAVVSLLTAFSKIGLLFLFEEIRRYFLASTEWEFRYHRRKLRVLFWVIFALTSIFAFFPLMSMITLAIPSNEETPQILIFLFFAVIDAVMGSSFELYGAFLLRSAFSNTTTTTTTTTTATTRYSRISQQAASTTDSSHSTTSSSAGGDADASTSDAGDTVQYAYGSINPTPMRNKLPESTRIAFKRWAAWTGSVCIAFGVLFYFALAVVRFLNVIVPPELETLLLVTEEALFLHSSLFAMFVIFAINRRQGPSSEDSQLSQL